MKLGWCGGNLCHDLMHDRRKAARCKYGFDVPPRREVGIDQHPQCRKEMSMRKVRLTGAVADAGIAALAQHAMAFTCDGGRVDDTRRQQVSPEPKRFRRECADRTWLGSRSCRGS
jgi:hypothetical protein